MGRTSTTENRATAVDSKLYDTEYFLDACEGYDEFLSSQGRQPSDRLSLALAYVGLAPGMRVLDVGCGRGEGVFSMLDRGAEVWGIDYSAAALDIARAASSSLPEHLRARHGFLTANARRLPFEPQAFDRALMFDIVEHLQPWELTDALREVFRVLKGGGQLVVHTGPNLWYYRYGYPFFRLYSFLHGEHLPSNPRDRFPHHRLVHVNEQSPSSLRRALTGAGFQARVWLLPFPARSSTGSGRFGEALANLAQSLPVVNRVFRNHIVAVAKKAGANSGNE